MGKLFLTYHAKTFPYCNQFSLGIKLYKFIQRCRNGKDSQSKSDADDSFSSCSQPSTSSACSESRPKKRKIEFSLPRFTPDVQRCIDKDAFYTHQLRNKLIRQACTALEGFHAEHGQPIQAEDKRKLAKLLILLAPKSLGDPKTVSKNPEVCCQVGNERGGGGGWNSPPPSHNLP